MELPDGRAFHVRGAWCDLYEAICNAKHLIYVTGWSIYDKITLVRDPSKPMLPSQWPTLGETIHALCCFFPALIRIPWPWLVMLGQNGHTWAAFQVH